MSGEALITAPAGDVPTDDVPAGGVSADDAELRERSPGPPAPARRLLLAIAALALVALCVPLLPVLGAVWKIGLAVLVILVLIDFLVRPPARGLVVRRELEGPYHVGREGRYRLSVQNTAAAPVQVALREFTPAEAGSVDTAARLELQPGEAWSTAVTFPALRRGRFGFPPLGLGVCSGLRLLEHRHTCAGGRALKVAPGRPAREVGWLISRAAVLEEAGSTSIRRPGADWEFESMRDYVTGDEPRHIDWKASARRHRPLVRQFETERNVELLLALDCGRLMGSLIDGVRKLDLAMTPVLDLAAVALRRGERVGLLAFDSKPRLYLPPRSGMHQLHAMTDGLAGLADTQETTSYVDAVAYLESRHRKRLTILVFTDFTDEITGRELVTSLVGLSRRHLTVFVAVADPHLERIFADGADSDHALFEKAVAGELIVERRAVLDDLQNHGVPTLDAEPHRLSGPLLNRYLELRLGGSF